VLTRKFLTRSRGQNGSCSQQGAVLFISITAIAVGQCTGRGAESYLGLRLKNRAARFGLADDVSLPSEFAMDKAVPGTSGR